MAAGTASLPAPHVCLGTGGISWPHIAASLRKNSRVPAPIGLNHRGPRPKWQAGCVGFRGARRLQLLVYRCLSPSGPPAGSPAKLFHTDLPVPVRARGAPNPIKNDIEEDSPNSADVAFLARPGPRLAPGKVCRPRAGPAFFPCGAPSPTQTQGTCFCASEGILSFPNWKFHGRAVVRSLMSTRRSPQPVRGAWKNSTQYPTGTG